jgi:hypothetical protein
MAARHDSRTSADAPRAEHRAPRARRIDCAPPADEQQAAAALDPDPAPERAAPRREDTHTIRTRRHR